MILARVVGEVVSTMKRPEFEGAKLLILQPETPIGHEDGHLAAGDRFSRRRPRRARHLRCSRAAPPARRSASKLAPVDAAIVGIVDGLDVPEPS